MPVRKVVKETKRKKKVAESKGKRRIAATTGLPDRRVGNDWWNLRSKHGRDKLFATPELLWEAACEYFQSCVDNPDKRGEIVKYEGWANVVDVKVREPFTREGLCGYLDCSTGYFRAFKTTLKEADKDYLSVIEKIEDVIQRQQYKGVLSGEYPGQIVSQYLGLVSRTDVTTKDEKVTTVAPAINIYNTAPPFATNEGEVDNDKPKE